MQYRTAAYSPDVPLSKEPLRVFLAILLVTLLHAPATAQARVISVDSRGGAEFKTLSEAAAVVKPGDTIQVAPGSGPYRETLWIRRSGSEDAPITVEGGGTTVTGFEPLTGFTKENEQWVCTLPIPFPCVLAYQGERLVQDPATGQFTKYATISPDGTRLSLAPGVTPDGWEISTRGQAVRLDGVSFHVYRNLRASGCRNDGFNLHGQGRSLIFENIEGFSNLDEGFSAHDQIDCEIRHGKFWRNDNGIGNAPSSSITVTDSSSHDNLGWGVWFAKTCKANLKNVSSWNNGMAQYRFDPGSEIHGESLLCGPEFPERRWISYNESRNPNPPKAIQIPQASSFSGAQPTIVPIETLSDMFAQ